MHEITIKLLLCLSQVYKAPMCQSLMYRCNLPEVDYFMFYGLSTLPLHFNNSCEQILSDISINVSNTLWPLAEDMILKILMIKVQDITQKLHPIKNKGIIVLSLHTLG